MQEILTLIYGYVRGIWRRRLLMLVTAWLVCVVGWVVVLKMPDEYSATARVHVDTQSMLRPLLRGLATQVSVGRDIDLITRTLRSVPNMEKLARMTDLDLNAKTPAEMESLLDSLAERISFSSAGKQNLYSISFSDSDPELAKKVVQSLLTIFVESSLGSSRKDSDTATRFLDEQIKDYEARLIEADNRLKEFKRKYVGMMPGEGRGYYSELQGAMTQVKEAQLLYDEAVNRRDKLKEQMVDAEDSLENDLIGEVRMGTRSSPLDIRIQSLQARLDELLLKYTDKHPDVVTIQNTIDGLQEEKNAELESLSEQAGEGSFGGNPVIQQLKISLSEAEAVVASVGTRLKEYQNRVAYLEKMVDVIPQIEVEFKNLNRDYNVVKKSYDTLLSRRESVRMGQDADETGEGVKFQIIDPPRVPLEPSGPNRRLYMSIVLLAGFGAGIALAFFLSQLKTTFDTRTSLRDATGLPVLGSISMDWTSAQRMRLRIEMAVFMGGTFFLFMLYAAAFLFQKQGAQLLAGVG